MDDDFSQLAFEDLFAHKSWKARALAYAAIPDATHLVLALKDQNAICRETALLGALESAITSVSVLAVADLVASTRSISAKTATNILVKYSQDSLENADEAVSALLSFATHKTPKTVSLSIAALVAVLDSADPNIAPIAKVIPDLFAHKDAKVREEVTRRRD